MQQSTGAASGPVSLGQVDLDDVRIEGLTAAWAGETAVLLWKQSGPGGDGMVMARMRDGKRQGPPVMLLPGRTVSDPAVAWSGEELGIAWQEPKEKGSWGLSIARTNAEAGPLTRLFSREGRIRRSSLAGREGELVATWLEEHEGGERVHVAWLLPEGAKQVALAAKPGQRPQQTCVACSVAGCALAVLYDGRLSFGMLEAPGTAPHMVALDTLGELSWIASFAGGETWELLLQTRGSEHMRVRLSKSGAVVARENLSLPQLQHGIPVLAPYDGGHAVAWNTYEGDLRLAWPTGSGSLGTVISVGAGLGVDSVHLAAQGSRLLLAWRDWRHGEPAIYATIADGKARHGGAEVRVSEPRLPWQADAATAMAPTSATRWPARLEVPPWAHPPLVRGKAATIALADEGYAVLSQQVVAGSSRLELRLLDRSCAAQGEPLLVAENRTILEGYPPGLARMDKGWTVVWDERPDENSQDHAIMVARIEEGASPSRRVLATGIRARTALVRAGNELAIVVTRVKPEASWAARMALLRLDGRGGLLGESDLGESPWSGNQLSAITWNGSEYGLAWQQFDTPPGRAQHVYLKLARLDPTGTPLAPPRAIAPVGENDTSYELTQLMLWHHAGKYSVAYRLVPAPDSGGMAGWRLARTMGDLIEPSPLSTRSWLTWQAGRGFRVNAPPSLAMLAASRADLAGEGEITIAGWQDREESAIAWRQGRGALVWVQPPRDSRYVDAIHVACVP